MADDDAARTGVALSEAIAPIVEQFGATIVDGGTRVGVMKLAGDARSLRGGNFALIGVVPEALVADVDLDERHTHFILVPGTRWGDESELLAALATTVAAGRATMTVLANGGDIAWEDAARSVELGRRVLVLGGTGRAADELAAGQTQRARALRATGLVDVVPIARLDEAAATVARALTRRASNVGRLRQRQLRE
jgi:hypothetical protein